MLRRHAGAAWSNEVCVVYAAWDFFVASNTASLTRELQGVSESGVSVCCVGFFCIRQIAGAQPVAHRDIDAVRPAAVRLEAPAI